MLDLNELLEEYKVAKKIEPDLRKKKDEAFSRLKAAENNVECNDRILIGIENIVEGTGFKLIHEDGDWKIV